MDSLSAFFRVGFGREEAIVIDNASDYRTLGAAERVCGKFDSGILAANVGV